MEKWTRFGILHQAWICTEWGSLYALRICTGMNAEKMTASMAWPTSPMPFVKWNYLDSLGKTTGTATADFFLLFGRKSWKYVRIDLLLLYHSIAKSREVQIWFGLACATNNGSLLSTRCEAWRRTAGSATCLPCRHLAFKNIQWGCGIAMTICLSRIGFDDGWGFAAKPKKFTRSKVCMKSPFCWPLI